MGTVGVGHQGQPGSLAGQGTYEYAPARLEESWEPVR